jgi:nicotinate-nucleotide adenylyltransferase
VERVTGILGGAFDPPHRGHVALARAAIEQLGLERLVVLVVAHPGHKGVVAPQGIRLELARLAFVDVHGAEVELDTHARTVDFLEERAYADAIFVVGADELTDFHRWKDPERVLELVRLGVARRPGVSDADLADALARVPDPTRVVFFDLEPLDVSSTEVRERVAAGEPLDHLVSRPVAEAIARLGLYRAAE